MSVTQTERSAAPKTVGGLALRIVPQCRYGYARR
jgi:hypothetical protein